MYVSAARTLDIYSQYQLIDQPIISNVNNRVAVGCTARRFRGVTGAVTPASIYETPSLARQNDLNVPRSHPGSDLSRGRRRKACNPIDALFTAPALGSVSPALAVFETRLANRPARSWHRQSLFVTANQCVYPKCFNHSCVRSLLFQRCLWILGDVGVNVRVLSMSGMRKDRSLTWTRQDFCGP